MLDVYPPPIGELFAVFAMINPAPHAIQIAAVILARIVAFFVVFIVVSLL